jgi:hypothetical protein
MLDADARRSAEVSLCEKKNVRIVGCLAVAA